MNNSLAGKSIIEQLEKKNKSYSDEFKKEEIDLKKEETNLISQKKLLNENEFKDKVNLFNKKVATYNKKRNEILNDLSRQRNDAQITLNKKLTPIVGKYAVDNSIAFMLSKENIIIGKNELDLTNVIIEILNKEIKTIKLK